MKDLFSKQSSKYALYRPTYPDELFAFILSHVKERITAWDVGTGNGQVAVKLSDFFETVYGTDISENQIANAIKKDNIIYKIMNSEDTIFPEQQFDLITIAQAIHWFDFNKFYSKVKVYLKPNRIIAAIGYDVIKIDPACDRIINRLYADILNNYWDSERKYIDAHYKTIPFPFKEITSPEFMQKAIWTFEQLTGYLNTWSAVQHFIEKNKQSPLELIISELQRAWGASKKKEIYFPVFIRIGMI